MTTILLIRHGQNDMVGKRLAGHMPGVHLNERGRQQAQAVAQALAKAPLKAIYSSPLERARETAEPLAAALDLPVILRPGLMEINFGSWQGKTTKQMQRLKLWKICQESPSQMCFPGGESFTDAQRRIVADVEEIASCHAAEDLVAAFSHADAIKLVVAHYLGMPLDNFQRLSIDLTSISVVHIQPDAMPHLGFINLIPGWEFKEPQDGRKKKRN